MPNRAEKLTYNVDLPGGAPKRLAEAILYVCEVCEQDEAFGLTRLNKILFEADFLAFGTRGEPITGVKYQRLQNGPAPKAMLPRLNELVERQDLAIKSTDFMGRPQKRPIALRRADLSVFSAEDIDLLNRVIRESWGKSATNVSNASHRIEWKTRENGDDIPYEAAWLSNAPVSEAESDRTQALAETHGW
jgi:hypothetical protein